MKPICVFQVVRKTHGLNKKSIQIAVRIMSVKQTIQNGVDNKKPDINNIAAELKIMTRSRFSLELK